MTTTDHTIPTGQDYLALSLLNLAHTDSLERQAMFGELYSTGDCPPHSYEVEEQTPAERVEGLIADSWNPEFVRMAREELFKKEEIPSFLKTSDVRDLDFVRISDSISHKWAVWEVRFTYDGKPCCGFLGGCPTYPHLMNEEKIEDCELNF